MTLTTSLIVQSGNAECQDRAEIISCGDRTVLVLADGAGEISGGAHAAECFVKLVREAAGRLHTATDCVQLLAAIDQELAVCNDCGETTGIVIGIDSARMFGASAGDSAAWLFTHERHDELTRGQQRKPLLGSGSAMPRSFNRDAENGTAIVASDGLWKYTSVAAIDCRVRSRRNATLASRLAELVRLNSGEFPDDVAIIACRIVMAESPFKLGDKIRVLQIPPSVKRYEPPEMIELFRRCVGQVFRIDDIDEHGHLELNVTNDGNQAPAYSHHTIWIEPEFVKAAD